MKKFSLIFQTTLCLLFLSQNALCPPKSRTTRGRQGEPATYLPTTTSATPETPDRQPTVEELLLGYSPTRKARRTKQAEPKRTFHGKGIYPSQETGCYCQEDDIHSGCRIAFEEGAIRCLIGLSLKPGDPECTSSLDSHIEILSDGLAKTNSEAFATKYCQFIKEILPKVIGLTRETLKNIKEELKVENLNEMETKINSLRSILRFYFKYLNNAEQVIGVPDYLINPEIMLFMRISMENETTLKFKFLYRGRTDDQQITIISSPVQTINLAS